jgi:hypothetical protein
MAVKDLGASGILYTDRRDFYIDPNVTKELWTDVTPFTTVVSTKETRQTNDPTFKMFEHRNPWVKQKCQTTEVITIPDNDVGLATNIDNIENLANPADDSWVGLIFEVWNEAETTNKGTVIVKSVVGGEPLFTSLQAGTVVTADNDFLHVVGNAFGEGTYSPEAWQDELEVVWNSTQIFKTPLEITGTLLQASLRGESSELARLRIMKGQEHKMQKEKAFLFGQSLQGTNLGESNQAGSFSDSFNDAGRTITTGGVSGKARTTYGIVSAINKYGSSDSTKDYQNIFTASEASYSYSNFVDDMEKVFQYVPEAGVKQAFCGAGALGYWSKMAGNTGMAGNSGWTVNISDMKRDALGFNYKALETPHGILQLIPTPALRGPYNKYMLVIDDSNMFHAQYRNQMYQTNIKTDNAYDGVKDQYFSDEGIGVSLIESHNLFKITA